MKVTLIALFVCLGGSIALAQSPDTFTPMGNLTMPRAGHSATLLTNGTVLIAGGVSASIPQSYVASAEIYDPSAGTFTVTGNMTTARRAHTATLLADGRVLVVGGFAATGDSIAASAELYDPSSGTFSGAGEVSRGQRQGMHGAALLGNGKVLIAGIGVTAVLFDPATDTFSEAGPYAEPSPGLVTTVTVLADGRVLITGCKGLCETGVTQLYDPDTNTFSGTGPMRGWFNMNTATLLMNGKVLFAGNAENNGDAADAELYDLGAGSFVSLGQAIGPHQFSAATLIPDGTVLITGGQLPGGNGDAGAELYHSATGTFAITGSMKLARHSHTATLLPDGTVLIAGGNSSWPASTSSAEIYKPPSLKAAPTLFSLSGDAGGQGAIWNSATGQVVSPSAPAVAGDTISMYITSLSEGAVIPPQVAIGGRLAEITFFGHAPGYPGFNQVNFRVPGGVAQGTAVPVRLTYLKRPSNQVTIAVR